LRPIWKEILTFDIHKPTDEVRIMVFNNYNNLNELLVDYEPF
jgi:hypothetical protein